MYRNCLVHWGNKEIFVKSFTCTVTDVFSNVAFITLLWNIVDIRKSNCNCCINIFTLFITKTILLIFYKVYETCVPLLNCLPLCLPIQHILMLHGIQQILFDKIWNAAWHNHYYLWSYIEKTHHWIFQSQLFSILKGKTNQIFYCRFLKTLAVQNHSLNNTGTGTKYISSDTLKPICLYMETKKIQEERW